MELPSAHMRRAGWLALAAVLWLTGASAGSAQVYMDKSSEVKLYCAVIANVKRRIEDFHYEKRSCREGETSCTSKWASNVLRNQSRNSTHAITHCELQGAPVTFSIAYDWTYSDDYGKRVETIEPEVFEWRGMFPDIGCFNKGYYHFAKGKKGLYLRKGRHRRTRRSRCQWTENQDSKLPLGYKGLPRQLTGAWVQRGGKCPKPDDPASRDRNVLWIQPHAIDRHSGQCWVSGNFNIGKRFTAKALCPGRGDYEVVNFKFDRLRQNSIRVKQGRSRRRTYERCTDRWIPPSEQTGLADVLKGTAFRVGMRAKVRQKRENGKIETNEHARTILLRVDDKGGFTDTLLIGDHSKSFKSQFGAVVPDSANDRATWLLRDGRLMRVRERRSYFELLSWSLSADRNSIKCDLKMDSITLRKDGKLLTETTSGKPLEIISFRAENITCQHGKSQQMAATKSDCQNAKSDRAVAACTVALTKQQESPQERSLHYLRRGMAYQETNNLDKAVSDYTEAAKLDPKNGEIFYHRAYVLHVQRKLEAALSDYNEAVRLRPNYFDARLARGTAHRDAKNYEAALADFNWAVSMRPDNPANYIFRALVLLRQSKNEQARADYRKIVSMSNATKKQKAHAKNQLGLAALSQVLPKLLNKSKTKEDGSGGESQLSLFGTQVELPEDFWAGTEKDQSRKSQNEQIRASHILLENEADAFKIIGMLATGSEFSELAKQHSLDQVSGKKGGDLGIFKRGTMSKEFENAAFGLQVGKFSKPVKSQLGWHVILLVER